MESLTVVRARVVGCGDLLGVLQDDGRMGFFHVVGCYGVPELPGSVRIHFQVPGENGEPNTIHRLTFRKKDRVITQFPGVPHISSQESGAVS